MKKIKKEEKRNLYYTAVQKGNDFLNKRKYKEAIVSYEEAMAIDPEDFLAVHNLGIVYGHMYNLKKAEKYLKIAFEKDRKNSLTALNLAIIYKREQKYTLSAKYSKIASTRYMGDEDFIKFYCSVLYELQHYQEAADYLEGNLGYCSENSDIHMLLIDSLIKLEQFDEAQRILNMVALSDKNSAKMQMQNSIIQAAQVYTKNIKIKNRKIARSLCEYIELVNEIKQNSGDIFIYRGQTNKYLPLVPSLYRNSDFMELEADIIQDFNLKAEAYFNQQMELFDKVDKITLMQHHGVPTRLLDFSESPLIALYFALEKISPDMYNVAPCVYMINLKAFTHNKKGYLLSSNQIKSDKDKEIFKFSTGTCAFSPKLKNKRMTAQKGVFVLFNENTPLELSVKDENITRIEIQRENIPKIQSELSSMCITPSTVYPDFMGLADEIKTPHKFVKEYELSEANISMELFKN